MKKEVGRKFHKSAEIDALFLHLPLLCCYGAAQIRLRMRSYGSIREGQGNAARKQTVKRSRLIFGAGQRVKANF